MAEEILELEVKSNVKGVTKEMDNLGGAIKDTTKEYKKLSDAVKKSNSKTKSTTDLLSRQIENFRVFGISIRTVKERMKLLGPVSTKVFSAIKTGVAATGIGAIVIAFGALFVWMKKSKVGAKALAGVFEFFGSVVASVTNLVVSVGDAVASLFGMRDTGALTAAEELKKAYENIDTVMARIEARQAKNQIQLIDLKRIVDDVTKSEKERLNASSKAAEINKKNNTEEIAAKQELLDLAKKELKSQQDFVKGTEKLGDLAAGIRKKRGINIAKAKADVADAEKIMNEAKTASYVAELGQIDEVTNIKSTNIKKNATAQTNAIAASTTEKDNAAKAVKDRVDAEKKQIQELIDLEQDRLNKLIVDEAALLDKFNESQLEAQDKEKNAVYDKYFAIIEGKIALGESVAELEENQQAELFDIEEKYRKKGLAADKKSAKKKIALEKFVEQSKMETISMGFNVAGSLAKEGSAAAKGIAVAQTIFNTQQSIMKAMADVPYPYNIVQSALNGIMGASAIQKILSTDPTGGGGGGGGATATASPPAPEMMSGSFELSGGQAVEPMQAYVVSDDITANQNKLAIIRRRATI